jgi:fructose-bisphosphate aldolase, class I
MGTFDRELVATAQALVAPGKGILAMDESNGTCNKRFEKLDIPTTEEHRRKYRELILTAPQLSSYISGAILYDETIRQSTKTGIPFTQIMKEAGTIVGIKVDGGAKELAGCSGEKITEGLDGLRDRIAEYYQMGARFAKWRAVIAIGTGIPSNTCIETNAHALARYAALCQEGGLVPIVEPEVLIDGDHSIDRCFEVTARTLQVVFRQLRLQRVVLEQMILKPSMVIAGSSHANPSTPEAVADMTIKCLRDKVPSGVPGIAFLSGGQTNEQSSQHLNLMNQKYASSNPWQVTFSYARAIQQPALECWRGKDANISAAQQLLCYRAKLNSAASKGEYTADLEKQVVLV